MTPGALNSLTIRIAWQQQPQQEQDACPLADSTFMIQVTRPCDSASRLISSTSLPRDRAQPALVDALLGPLAHHRAVAQRLAAAVAGDLHGHPTLALADAEDGVAVQDHFQPIRGQGHGVGLDGAADREHADERRRARLPLLIVGDVAGLVQGLEQLGEAAMPGGQGLGRLADQHHLEDAGHDRHQAILLRPVRAARGDRPLDHGKPMEDRLDLVDGPVLGLGDVCRSPPGELPQVPHDPASSSVNRCWTKATSSSQTGGPIRSGLASFSATWRWAIATPGNSVSFLGRTVLGRGVTGPTTPWFTSITRRGPVPSS